MKIASGSPVAAAWMAEETSVARIGYGTSWVVTPERSSTVWAYSALWVIEPNSP